MNQVAFFMAAKSPKGGRVATPPRASYIQAGGSRKPGGDQDAVSALRAAARKARRMPSGVWAWLTRGRLVSNPSAARSRLKRMPDKSFAARNRRDP